MGLTRAAGDRWRRFSGFYSENSGEYGMARSCYTGENPKALSLQSDRPAILPALANLAHYVVIAGLPPLPVLDQCVAFAGYKEVGKRVQGISSSMHRAEQGLISYGSKSSQYVFIRHLFWQFVDVVCMYVHIAKEYKIDLQNPPVQGRCNY